jgi:hypothetical protein
MLHMPVPGVLLSACYLQEASRFAKHMKDPEFIKLLEQYARDISEPEVTLAANQRNSCHSSKNSSADCSTMLQLSQSNWLRVRSDQEVPSAVALSTVCRQEQR